MSIFKDKTLLITGGTGSFGNAVLRRFLNTDIREIRIFSRDEKKQDDMRHEYQVRFPEVAHKIKFFIGDVRSLESCRSAMPGVDYIFHAAALKQVPSCEFFPMEAVKTNVISSPGFADYLPQGYKFLISHNFDIDLVKKALTTTVQPFSIEPIRILTIGGIRDYSSNSEEIIALSNVENVKMDFVGKGPSKETLEKLANEIGTKNITFTGYYEKKDEVDIVLKSSFMNIYYPKIKSHSSALSNRFYNSLMYCRPMIVTKGGVQGNYAEKYHVGISIDSADQILGEIKNWIETVNFVEYQENCKKLLEEFLNDYESFKESVYNFILG